MGAIKKRYQFIFTFGSLFCIFLGFILGAVAFESNYSFFIILGNILKPLGELWTNALRMIILPLMCSYIFLSIASNQSLNKAGKIGIQTIKWFAILLFAAVVFALILVPPIFDQLPVDPSIQKTLAQFKEISPTSFDFQDSTIDNWVLQLIPTNLLAAASKDQFIPIIVATLLFALATIQLPNNVRNPLLDLVRAINETTIILVGWLLKLMPLGVFALTYVIASQSGFSFAGTLGYYILVKSVLVLGFTIIVYFLPVVIGKIPFGHFSWGILPAQLVAASTRSSLASLPSLMDCANNRLKLDREISGLVLPLSVSAFKLDVAITSFIGLFFLTNLHGIELSSSQLAVFTAGTMLFCFAAPGIPIGGLPHQTPLFLAMGIPIESTLLLSAVGQLPDVFQTVLNVTADISIASVVNRFFKRKPGH